MADYETTMKGLLSGFKTSVLSARSSYPATVGKVVTFKRGMLASTTVFPAIAIVPVQESYPYIYSSGKYVTSRLIRVDVYHTSYDPKLSVKSSMDVIRDIKEWLKTNDNYQLKTDQGSPRCFSYDVSEVTYANPQKFEDRILTKSSFYISFISRHTFPEETVQTGWSFTDADALLEQVKTVFDSAITAGDLSVSKVYKTNFRPVMQAKTALLMYVSEALFDRHSSVKDVQRTVKFHIYTQKLPIVTNLNNNLDYADQAKNLVFKNYGWGALALSTEVNNIIYGEFNLDGVMLYDSELTFTVNTFERSQN